MHYRAGIPRYHDARSFVFCVIVVVIVFVVSVFVFGPLFTKIQNSVF
jgi:hypothetical protein